MAARWWSAAGGLGRALPFLFLLFAFAGCAEEAGDFAVSPSLDPRASKIVPIRPGGFLSGRTCLVYLPPGVSTPGRRYPVLYVHDGENAFDGGPASAESFGFDRAADALIAAGEIEPLIIVAIPGAGRRSEDYLPSFDWDSEAGAIAADEDLGGARYVRALLEDLKPMVNRTFATDPSPRRTGIAGFSFGGLISVYAGYAHPETFGIVGGFSGSYYPTLLHWVEQEGKGPDASLFIDVGMVDDNVVEAEWLDDLALTQGFVPGVDYEYRPVSDGNHTTASVRTRIPAFLKFFSRRVAVSRAVAGVTPR